MVVEVKLHRSRFIKVVQWVFGAIILFGIILGFMQ